MRLAFVLSGLLLLSLPALRAEDAEGGPRTFKIGPATQIQLDAAEATAPELKAGQHATVVEDTLQPGFAATIDAQTIAARGESKDSKAPAAKAKTDKPAAGPKHWTITAVTAASITIAYK